MIHKLCDFWNKNQVRIVLYSFLVTFATGMFVAFFDPTSEFGAGVFGLLFGLFILLDTMGDLMTGKTAMKDGNNQNITINKNPIQFWMAVAIGVASATFIMWFSCCAIASAI